MFPNNVSTRTTIRANTVRSVALSTGQTDSQVDASLQNQNVRTDLRRVAKRIRMSQRAVNFTHIIG